MTSRRSILRRGAVTLIAGIGSVGTISAADHENQRRRRGPPENRGGSNGNRPDHAGGPKEEDADEDDADAPTEGIGGTLGYYFPTGTDPKEIPLKNLTDVCFHALDIDHDGRPIVRHEHEMSVIADRATEAGITPHLQIGGMEVDFTPAVAHTEVFAEGVVDVMEEYGYSGIAIDWEYPEDGSEFAQLIEGVHEALKSQGGGHLGAAVSAVPSIADGVYAVDAVSPLVDYLLVMSYDFAGPWSSRTGHNSALYSTSTEPLSVESAISYWRDKPIADDKLLAGLPFYGRSFSGASETNNGYDQPFESGNAYSYTGVQSLLAKDHFEEFWDAEAGVPYAYSAEEQTFLSHESPDSISAKAAYARNEIGGVGIWAINQDPEAALLSAVR